MLDEILQERFRCSRSRRNKRGLKRKMRSFPIRSKSDKPHPPIDIATAIRILRSGP